MNLSEPLQGVVLGGAIGLLVALVQGVVSIVHSRLQARRDVMEQDRRERRAAYIALLRQVDEWKAKADGALMTSSPITASTTGFAQTIAAAEFYAPPAVWARMEPCVEALNVMVNGMSRFGMQSPAMIATVREAIAERGADTHEGWEALRQELIAAARDDLGIR